MQSTTALPDIIFLDINMPVMDGWQFLDSFRNIEDMLSKKITIYLVSSSVDKNDMSRSKQISLVKDYLIKPVYKDMFSQVLQTLHN
jgi:CheY-like chemotaxis protein